MTPIFTLSQSEIDRLKEAGLIPDGASMTWTHKEKGQDYFNVIFETSEEWYTVFEFLHGKDEPAPDPKPEDDSPEPDGKVFTFRSKALDNIG